MYKILIVEDDGLFAEDMAVMLKQRGTEIAGIAETAEEAKKIFDAEKPDLVFIDIELKGEGTGIDVAQYIQRKDRVPFIFLTRFSGTEYPEYFNKVLDTKPYNFLAKGEILGDKQLWHMVEYAMECYRIENSLLIEGFQKSYVIRGFLYLKANTNNYNQLPLQTITHIQTGIKYATIYTENGNHYTVRKSLKELVEFLRTPYIVQISQSFAVNIYYVKEFNKSESILYLQQYSTAYKIGKEYRKMVMPVLPNLV